MNLDRRTVDSIMADRPFKLRPEQVGYRDAPSGSAMRCAACLHLYVRAIDGHRVCELIRDDEIDLEGIRPDYRCDWFTVDGDVYPLAPEPPAAEPPPADAPAESDATGVGGQ
jgi:hypothetical protein